MLIQDPEAHSEELNEAEPTIRFNNDFERNIWHDYVNRSISRLKDICIEQSITQKEYDNIFYGTFNEADLIVKKMQERS